MARSNAVWGIDVGQCALKALKCRAHDDSKKITVEAFDYIEYPKILTQPDANPAELIAEALEQFLSRNSVRGDRVAISLSGQSGLARFIKLPPVEAKKIPDIVRYEAKQQIPFDLNDVIWDFQRMGGGSEEEGFVLETEIGLFAIKRDVVFRALEPFQKAGIEVDVVQLTPLTLYNFVLFDQMRDLPPPEEYDPESPPESVAIISLGTDATDLVVTNGYKVWQRSVPIGGSHFTKALTKDLKLTFAKAEHLKRNATSAQDPKAVFQAMRPVFSDLQTELDRSLHHFANIDRTAKIGRVIALGNAFKLPGLRRYLSQSMGQEIDRIEAFQGMEGPEVMATPAFKDNLLSFGVCYGLALQALNKAGLKTNLLPKEIRRDRLIKEKKPWAVAAAAVVLLGLTISYTAYALALATVSKTAGDGAWEKVEGSRDTVAKQSQLLQKNAAEAKTAFDATKQIGEHLVSNVEGRDRWLELMQAINQSLPQYRTPPEKSPPLLPDRIPIVITSIECQPVEDVGKWWAWVTSQRSWYEPPPTADTSAVGGVATPPVPAATPEPAVPVPAKPGAGPAVPLTPGPGPAAPGPGPAAPPVGPAVPGPAVPVPGPAVKPAAASVPASAAASVPASAAASVPASAGAVAPALAAIGPAGTLLAQATPPPGTGPAGVPGGAPGATGAPTGEEGPTGAGFLVQIVGKHYHIDRKDPSSGVKYVRNTLITKLATFKEVSLPSPDGKGTEKVSMKELGIGYPVLIDPKTIDSETILFAPPDASAGGPAGKAAPAVHRPGAGDGTDTAPGQEKLEMPKFDFRVVFVWKPTSAAQRQKDRDEKAKKEQATKPAR